jgi:hypothetical protein
VTEPLPKQATVDEVKRGPAVEPNVKPLPAGPTEKTPPPDVDTLTLSAGPLMSDDDETGERETKKRGEWSLDRLKRDILGRRKTDETTE